MNDHRNDDFDGRMRAVHAQAVDRVPWQTTQALRIGREAAARGERRPAARTGGWWWMAASTAAVFALAIGVFRPGTEPAPLDDTQVPLAAVAEAADAAAFEDGAATLDEDPDLYLWLGSQDGLLAME